MSVEIPRSPACLMCASARTRSSCPAMGSCPTARTELGPSSLNRTCEAPSSRFMSSNDSSTVPFMVPTVAPVREAGRSPSSRTSFALASTLASDTRSAARSGTVTSTWSSRLPSTCVRKGKPLMSTSGLAFRCSALFSCSSALCCAYSTANRSDSARNAPHTSTAISSFAVLDTAANRRMPRLRPRWFGGFQACGSSSSERRPRPSGSSLSSRSLR